MDSDSKIILFIFIGFLAILLWSANSSARNSDPCEGMTNAECGIWQDRMEGYDRGW